MEAKNTVMDMNKWLDRNGIDRAYKKDMKKTYDAIKGDLEAQAEISFPLGKQVGIKEVVNSFLEAEIHSNPHSMLKAFNNVLTVWQAFLKGEK